jgi:23S rRNA (cytosine1962-C5)-methyltransferase
MKDKIVEETLRRKLADLGAESVARRDCVRLFAGKADGREGLLIDRFGSLCVAIDYARSAKAETDVGLVDSARGLAESLRDVCGDIHLIAKIRSRDEDVDSFTSACFTPKQSAALPIVGTERGLRFEIGTDPAHDFGVFLDAAKARQYVRSIAKDKCVLNLFAYTAGFGVAAAVGGAESVTNVDPNRIYLAWGLRNAALNGVNFRVLPDTAQVFLRKHLRRLERATSSDSPPPRPFDLVIVDPPAFGVGRGRERVLRLLWPEIFSALRAMKPQDLVILCNDKYFRERTRFEDLVCKELGAAYDFRRLGTCMTIAEIKSSTPPAFEWSPCVEDPHYMEPVVLAGTRR